MKIKVVKEPPFGGPNYAKESLVGLTFPTDENASREENAYAVKKEDLITELEKQGDIIALGWWQEHLWPPKERWIYFPKDCCQEIDDCGEA